MSPWTSKNLYPDLSGNRYLPDIPGKRVVWIFPRRFCTTIHMKQQKMISGMEIRCYTARVSQPPASFSAGTGVQEESGSSVVMCVVLVTLPYLVVMVRLTV
jgi:hypothetical protein